MKLENINDVLKENMSKDCRIYYLASCILDCDEYSNLYESCSNYDEFEKRVLNEECCLNVIYSYISLYGKDRRNHWYRIRELFGDHCFKTASDVGSLLVGNEEFQALIPNGYGDGITRVAIFNKGGLPLGNQTSQLLALYYLHPVDILIQNKYGVMFDYGALFSRYMDDLALIAEDKQTLIDAYRDIDFILRNALNLCFNDKTSIHPLKNGIGFLGWNYYLLKTGRVLKKRKKDAKDRAKKKVKLAIYLYEENIIDARSYGNRITSVLATLKKGDAGAFQRTLILMQSA